MLERSTVNRWLAVIIGCLVAIVILIVIGANQKGIVLSTQSPWVTDPQLHKYAKEAHDSVLFFEIPGTHLCVGYLYQGHAPNMFRVPCAEVEDRLTTFDR